VTLSYTEGGSITYPDDMQVALMLSVTLSYTEGGSAR